MNDVKIFERRLREAMINHDCEELERLESEHLLFINHMGQKISKNDDIELHKQAAFNIKNITCKSQEIQEYGEVAIVISDVVLTLATPIGEIEDHLIYTRVWRNENGQYILVAGQATQVK